MPKKRRKLNKDFEKKIYTSKKNDKYIFKFIPIKLFDPMINIFFIKKIY